jgi:hypothetical protein
VVSAAGRGHLGALASEGKATRVTTGMSAAARVPRRINGIKKERKASTSTNIRRSGCGGMTTVAAAAMTAMVVRGAEGR